MRQISDSRLSEFLLVGGTAHQEAGVLPDRYRRFAERVVARDLRARNAAFDPLLHASRQFARLDQIQVERGDVPEVEEVALPVPFAAPGVAEPAATDAVHLLLGAVGVGRDLLPETDDFAL